MFPLALLLICCPSADEQFRQGLELAGAGWEEAARRTFEAAAGRNPRDKRFPIELAGLAYRRNELPEARRLLQRALHLDAADPYANDFLATLYFLDGNLEAALKYWNRAGKPRIDEFEMPQSAVDPFLLDRALAFPPVGLLTLEDYRISRARLDWLGLFDQYRFELVAEPGGGFRLHLRVLERGGLPAVLASARGLPYHTLHTNLFNLDGAGGHWMSLVRWDAQKRRLATGWSAPWRGSPRWRYQLFADARAEVWNLGEPEDFRMRRLEMGAGTEFLGGWRYRWRGDIIAVHRDFAAAPGFAEGVSLKYRTKLEYRMADLPEKGFRLDGGMAGEFGRLLADARPLFGSAQGALAAQWIPGGPTSKHEIRAALRAGRSFGQPPFDELFLIGVERDTGLWLRGHAGTRNGKKGSAPLARDYILINGEWDRELYRHPLFRLRVGPLVDLARVYRGLDSSPSERWLMDAGLQARIRLPGGLTAAISWGRDVRGGAAALYASIGSNVSLFSLLP